MSYDQITFSFKGTEVTTIISNIIIPDVRRPLRPSYTRRKIEIPGRDGSWDFGPGNTRDFNIEVDVTIVGEDSSDLMSKMRSLSNFLSGKGALVFSDDLDITYQAQVFTQVMPQRRVFSYAQSGTIIFECDAGESTYVSGFLITGSVVDFSTSLYIDNADVELYSGHNADTDNDPTLFSTSTDNGEFLFSGISSGDYTIKVSKTGYVTEESNHTIVDENIMAIFMLNPV